MPPRGVPAGVAALPVAWRAPVGRGLRPAKARRHGWPWRAAPTRSQPSRRRSCPRRRPAPFAPRPSRCDRPPRSPLRRPRWPVVPRLAPTSRAATIVPSTALRATCPTSPPSSSAVRTAVFAAWWAVPVSSAPISCAAPRVPWTAPFAAAPTSPPISLAARIAPRTAVTPTRAACPPTSSTPVLRVGRLWPVSGDPGAGGGQLPRSIHMDAEVDSQHRQDGEVLERSNDPAVRRGDLERQLGCDDTLTLKAVRHVSIETRARRALGEVSGESEGASGSGCRRPLRCDPWAGPKR
jgi:hypothetical protein